MRAIQIVSSNESLFLRAAQITKVKVAKLPKILDPGYVYYRAIAPFSQQDIFRLGVAYERLVVSANAKK